MTNNSYQSIIPKSKTSNSQNYHAGLNLDTINNLKNKKHLSRRLESSLETDS